MSGARIMLADDDDALRMLVRTTLPREGFQIVEARDGQEALDLLAEGALDLVVLDWKMPERSGEDVLRELKSVHPSIPVIVLTAEHQPRERQVAESLGADDFLTKPFSPLQLLGTVERLLAQRSTDAPREPA